MSWDLPLASAWVVHEQRRATGQNLSAAQWMALQQIACEFSTVEGFWTSFEHLPPPSTVFYDGKSSKRAESIVVVGGDDDGETSAADSDLACQYPPCTGSGPPLVRT